VRSQAIVVSCITNAVSRPATSTTDSCRHLFKTYTRQYSNKTPKNAFVRKKQQKQGPMDIPVLSVSGWEVTPWSIAALETCVVAQKENLSLAFDMGYSFRKSVSCPNVLISHGHIDHVGGLVSHAGKRSLYGMKPAAYHVLPHLVEPLTRAALAFGDAHEDDRFCNMNFQPTEVGKDIRLSGDWYARTFPTIHRVASQGYIVYSTKKALQEQYKGLPSDEIRKLVKEGINVHEVTNTPEIAYTGDTQFDVFLNPPTEDLLKVKVLITEATYIDSDVDKQGKTSQTKAKERGHCHLIDFIENKDIFSNIENIVLIHFSDKYSVDYIERTIQKTVPEDLRRKMHAGIQHKI